MSTRSRLAQTKGLSTPRSSSPELTDERFEIAAPNQLPRITTPWDYSCPLISVAYKLDSISCILSYRGIRRSYPWGAGPRRTPTRAARRPRRAPRCTFGVICETSVSVGRLVGWLGARPSQPAAAARVGWHGPLGDLCWSSRSSGAWSAPQENPLLSSWPYSFPGGPRLG